MIRRAHQPCVYHAKRTCNKLAHCSLFTYLHDMHTIDRHGLCRDRRIVAYVEHKVCAKRESRVALSNTSSTYPTCLVQKTSICPSWSNIDRVTNTARTRAHFWRVHLNMELLARILFQTSAHTLNVRNVKQIGATWIASLINYTPKVQKSDLGQVPLNTKNWVDLLRSAPTSTSPIQMDESWTCNISRYLMHQSGVYTWLYNPHFQWLTPTCT